MNPQKLLEQFLGPDVLANLSGQQKGGRVPASTGVHGSPQVQGSNSIGDLISGALGGGGQRTQGGGGFGVPGGALGGVVAGGILGMLLGQKKVRKMAGGALGYGGAAALGALAHRA